jgi:hypothetical protein
MQDDLGTPCGVWVSGSMLNRSRIQLVTDDATDAFLASLLLLNLATTMVVKLPKAMASLRCLHT